MKAAHKFPMPTVSFHLTTSAALSPEAAAFNKFTWRRIEGACQFAIMISTKEQLLLSEERLLAVLRWMQLQTSPQKRWYPVLSRYIHDVVGRVWGFGGDPAKAFCRRASRSRCSGTKTDGLSYCLCSRITAVE